MAEKDTTGAVPPESGWDDKVAVTGRPVDVAAPNTTFAQRAAARVKAQANPAPDESAASARRRRK